MTPRPQISASSMLAAPAALAEAWFMFPAVAAAFWLSVFSLTAEP